MHQYKYKLKDKQAEIFKDVIQLNSKGTPLHYWRPLRNSPLWCFTQNLSGNILLSPLVVEHKEERLFVFNFLSDVSQGYAIKYKNQWYKITRVNSFDDYNTEIFCYAAKMLTPSENFVLTE